MSKLYFRFPDLVTRWFSTRQGPSGLKLYSTNMPPLLDIIPQTWHGTEAYEGREKRYSFACAGLGVWVSCVEATANA